MTPSLYLYVNGSFSRVPQAAPIRTEKFGERALDQLQQNLVEAIRPLLLNQLLSGNILSGVPFESGVHRQLPHMLDRAFTGFLITRLRGNPARFVEVDQASQFNERLITLMADADCTADVYVF